MISRPQAALRHRRPMKVVFFLALAALTASAPALEAARMALPEGFAAAATRYEATGFGGRNKGEYRLAGYTGKYTRGESRLGVFDPLLVSNKGKSSFTVTGESAQERLSAECKFGKKTVTIDIVTFDPKKMAYDCDFRRDGRLDGSRLVLGQPKADGMKEKLLAKDRRRGEALVAGQHFVIESVHDYDGSKLGSQAPLGYLIDSGGRTVAAVDLLDWNPIVFLLPELDAPARDAALTVALALAVLRDPANSALEE